jgi:hypothetical protein
MISITGGNIIEADAEALVNTVNCVGYMGKGAPATLDLERCSFSKQAACSTPDISSTFQRNGTGAANLVLKILSQD